MSLPTNFSFMGLGTSRLASLGSRLRPPQARDLFGQALQAGASVIDTADTYGSGDAERLVAKAIEGKRDDYFIITKAGFPYMALPALLSPVNQFGKKLYGTLKLRKNFSKKYLIASLSKSLARLETDAVDLFLLHEPSRQDLVNHPDFFEGLLEIRERGMAKNVGISTEDIGAFNLAVEKKVVDFVQTALPFNGNADSVLKQAKSFGIPVIANQVMRIMPFLVSDKNFMEEMRSQGLQHNDIPTLIMNYAHKHKQVDCILTGTRNIDHLKQNINSLRFEKNTGELYSIISNMII